MALMPAASDTCVHAGLGQETQLITLTAIVAAHFKQTLDAHPCICMRSGINSYPVLFKIRGFQGHAATTGPGYCS
jgi:hypothetical protein